MSAIEKFATEKGKPIWRVIHNLFLEARQSHESENQNAARYWHIVCAFARVVNTQRWKKIDANSPRTRTHRIQKPCRHTDQWVWVRAVVGTFTMDMCRHDTQHVFAHKTWRSSLEFVWIKRVTNTVQTNGKLCESIGESKKKLFLLFPIRRRRDASTSNKWISLSEERETRERKRQLVGIFERVPVYLSRINYSNSKQ